MYGIAVYLQYIYLLFNCQDLHRSIDGLFSYSSMTHFAANPDFKLMYLLYSILALPFHFEVMRRAQRENTLTIKFYLPHPIDSFRAVRIHLDNHMPSRPFLTHG